MQGKRTVKRQKLTRQIRRNQINRLMAECRSKMLLVWRLSSQEDRSSMLNSIVPGNMRQMERIKRFVQCLVKKDDEPMKEEAEVNIDLDKVNLLLTLPEGSKFCIKPTNQQCWVEQKQVCQCLKLVSRQICTTIDILNKDMHKLNKITVVNHKNQQIIQHLLAKIYQITADLKLISEYYHLLLRGCAQLLSTLSRSSLNQKMVEEITSCLIELSCFRPRKYANPMNLPYVDQINKIMKDYRESFTVPASKQLIVLANQYAYNSPNIKILTNIIYIFGNIFVSMSASEHSVKNHYAQIHDFIFAIFKHVLRIQGQLMSDLNKKGLLPSGKEQFDELASLMVWFIRNQILIVEGMYQSLEDNKAQGSGHQPKLIDNNWIDISFLILSKISQSLSTTSTELTELQANTVGDTLSLIKLLSNDFNLTSKHMWDVFKLIYPLCLKLRQSKQPFQVLRSKIYQFFIDFIDYKFADCQEFCLSKQLTQISPFILICQQAYSVIHREELTEASLRLCRKVINPQQCSKDPQRMKIYQQICTYFQAVLKTVQRLGLYEVTREFINVAQAVIRIFEAINHSSSMQVEFLSLDILVHLLKLCEAIWLSEKSLQDIITSLELLRTIADNQHISNFLKEVILKEGYREQLEALSAHPNQDINRLVYEVYELLDLQ